MKRNARNLVQTFMTDVVQNKQKRLEEVLETVKELNNRGERKTSQITDQNIALIEAVKRRTS